MNSNDKRIEYFYVYNHAEQEWQKVELEMLAQFNDETLTIVPVYTNGEQGEQTTWGAFLSATKTKKGFWQTVGNILTADLAAPIKHQIELEKKAEEAEQKKQRHQEEKQQKIEKQNKELSATNLLKIKSEIEQTTPMLRKACRLFLFMFVFNIYIACIALGIALADGALVFYGAIGGLAVGAIIHFVVFAIISD